MVHQLIKAGYNVTAIGRSEAALSGGVRRYIRESFAPIYLDCGDQWIDENTPPHPAKYDRVVLDTECVTRRFTQQGGMGIALRFAYLYGPDSPTTVATTRYAERGWGLVFGALDAYYSSISHDDAAAAMVATLDLPAGIYNVSDDVPFTRRPGTQACAPDGKRCWVPSKGAIK